MARYLCDVVAALSGSELVERLNYWNYFLNYSILKCQNDPENLRNHTAIQLLNWVDKWEFLMDSLQLD